MFLSSGPSPQIRGTDLPYLHLALRAASPSGSGNFAPATLRLGDDSGPVGPQNVRTSVLVWVEERVRPPTRQNFSFGLGKSEGPDPTRQDFGFDQGRSEGPDPTRQDFGLGLGKSEGPDPRRQDFGFDLGRSEGTAEHAPQGLWPLGPPRRHAPSPGAAGSRSSLSPPSPRAGARASCCAPLAAS